MLPVTVPRITQYEDSEYDQSQYDPLYYVQPTYYGGPNTQSLSSGSTLCAMGRIDTMPPRPQFCHIDQPLSYHNLISYEDVNPEERSSYYETGPAATHLHDSIHSPVLLGGSSNWVDSGDNKLPTYQSDSYHTLYSNKEHFYHGDDRFVGDQFPENDRFYYPNVAYPYSYHSLPINAEMRLHGCSRLLCKRECVCALWDPGNIQDTHPNTVSSRLDIVGNSRYQYEASYINSDKFNSAGKQKPIGWERQKLACKNNVGSYDRELPSEHNSSDQQHEYMSKYNSEPTETWEVASSLSALESGSSSKESGDGKAEGNKDAQSDTKPAGEEDDKTECNKLTSSDIELKSSVETENLPKSTSKKVVKEKRKKAKPSPSRRKKNEKHSTPIFHIRWDGFDEQECETTGQVCLLCEEDLMLPQVEDNYFEYYELIDKSLSYLEVSVLPCGHAFHTPCLEQATPEKLCRDPICFICWSCES